MDRNYIIYNNQPSTLIWHLAFGKKMRFYNLFNKSAFFSFLYFNSLKRSCIFVSCFERDMFLIGSSITELPPRR